MCSQVFCTGAELTTHCLQECGQLLSETGSTTAAVDTKPEELNSNVQNEYESDVDGDMFGGRMCKFCNNVFSNKSSLRYHQRFVHNFKDIYSCKTCGERFTFKKQLVAHRLTHPESERNAYECWLCHDT